MIQSARGVMKALWIVLIAFSLTSQVKAGSLEGDICLEEWMTISFATTFQDSDIELESWMSNPFGEEYFVSDEQLEMEPWMESSWFEEEVES